MRRSPCCASYFCGIPMRQLLNGTASLSDLPARLQCPISRLAELTSPSNRFDCLTVALRRRLPDVRTPDWVVGEALTQMTAMRIDRTPAISVLVHSLGVSERSLERRFTAQVGLTPVQYRRLVRFRASLRRYANGGTNWSDIAASTGFSDQSHLVREFRDWAGLSPTAWAASQASAVGFIQDANVSIF
jgi:AraC-like DNA-binding protein